MTPPLRSTFTTGILAPDHGHVIDVAVGSLKRTQTERVPNIEPVQTVTSDIVADVTSALADSE